MLAARLSACEVDAMRLAVGMCDVAKGLPGRIMPLAIEWRWPARYDLSDGLVLSAVPASETGDGGAGERVGVVVVELPQRRLLPG